MSGESIDRLVAQLWAADESPDRLVLLMELQGQSPYAVIPRLRPRLATLAHDQPTAGLLLRDLLECYVHWGVPDAGLLGLALGSPNPVTRAQAVRVLGRWWSAYPRPYDALAAAAEDADPRVRRAAVGVCARLETRRAAGVLRLVAHSPMEQGLRDAYDEAAARLAELGPAVPYPSRRQRLRALSYGDLAAEPRDATTLAVMLLHPDQPGGELRPTLDALAEQRNAGSLEVLIDVLGQAEEQLLQAKPALAAALAGWEVGELRGRQDTLRRFVNEADAGVAREAFLAALICSVAAVQPDGAVGLLMAMGIDEARMLRALRWVPEPETRDRFYQAAGWALSGSAEPGQPDEHADLRLAAIDALPHIPAARAELAVTLTRVAYHDPDTEVRFAAIAALQAHHDNGGPAPPDDLRLTRVEVAAVPNLMQYDPTTFTVTAGRPVELTLTNPDTMEHNLVITAPGRRSDVGLDAALLDPQAGAQQHFVPDSPHVLHWTPQVRPGDTAVLRFIAPDEPGDYPFVCTYPGHWTTMHGIMHVTAP